MKAKIDLLEHIGLGLIVEWPTGVAYSNQTGGTSCLHPEFEGIFIPLRNDYQPPDGPMLSPENELLAYFEGPKHEGTGATRGLDDEDVEFITGVLTKWSLDTVIEIDRSRMRESHEAWVHVTVLRDETFIRHEASPVPLFELPPYPRRGVLTWSNSD
jgi:hypothetical protein